VGRCQGARREDHVPAFVLESRPSILVPPAHSRHDAVTHDEPRDHRLGLDLEAPSHERHQYRHFHVVLRVHTTRVRVAGPARRAGAAAVLAVVVDRQRQRQGGDADGAGRLLELRGDGGQRCRRVREWRGAGRPGGIGRVLS
jgi:hypothetical protein